MKTLLRVTSVLACLVLACTAWADVHWTGTVSSDWGTEGNWEENVLPGSSDNVYLYEAGFAPTNQNIAGLAIQDLYFDTNFTSGITIGGEAFSLDDIASPDAGPNVVTHRILCDLTILDGNHAGLYSTIQDNITVELAGNIDDGGNGYYLGQYKVGGTLILSGSNTFGGTVVAHVGTIRFYRDENLGAPLSPKQVGVNYGAMYLDKPAGVDLHRVTIGAGRTIRKLLTVTSDDIELHCAGGFIPFGAETAFILQGAGNTEFRLAGDSTNLVSEDTVRLDDGWFIMESTNALGGARVQSYDSTVDFNGLSMTNNLYMHSTYGVRVAGAGGDAVSWQAHFENNNLDVTSVLAGDFTPTFQANLGTSYGYGGRGDITLTGGFHGPYELRKNGSGTLRLAGVSTYTGVTYAFGGGLVLDHTAENTARLSANAFAPYGTEVTMLGNDSSDSSETVGNLALGGSGSYMGGHTILSVVAGNADATFSFDGFSLAWATKDEGRTIDFRTSSTGSGTAKIIGRSAANAAAIGDILSVGATFNGETWAQVDANSNIVGMTSGFSSTSADDVHWDVPDGPSTVSAAAAPYTTRFADPDGGATVTLDATLTPWSILMSPDAGGDVTIGGSSALGYQIHNVPMVVHQHNTNFSLTISALMDNINSAGSVIVNVGLCKVGPGGLIVNNDANEFTSEVGVFDGTLTVTSIGSVGEVSALGTGTQGAGIYIGTATLKYTGNGDSTDRILRLSGTATIEAAGTGTLCFTNATAVRDTDDTYGSGGNDLILTGNGNGQIDGNIAPGCLGGLFKRGSGTWTLNGTNSYWLATVIEEGTLELNGTTRGDVEVQSGGTLETSGATLMRDLTLGGTLVYNLGASSTPLHVQGEVTLGGALTVTKTGATQGTILTSDYPISGTFDSVDNSCILVYSDYAVTVAAAGTMISVR